LLTASAPELHPVNFHGKLPVLADSLVNLTVKIINCGNLLLTILWSRDNGNLPKDSNITNYTRDGNNYASLIIYKVSYYNDGGTYYLSVSNYCGTSIISVTLKVAKGMTYMLML